MLFAYVGFRDLILDNQLMWSSDNNFILLILSQNITKHNVLMIIIKQEAVYGQKINKKL